MIKNYLKIAFRNIKRFKTYSILNVSGMAIGMACAILILLWVQYEWSYDRNYKNADNLYRIIENNLTGNGFIAAPTPAALPLVLKKEYPEIIRSTRFGDGPEFILQKGDIYIDEKVVMVDSDFFKMFDIHFIRGDIKTVLSEPHNIIITDKMAHKYFKGEDPIGKILTAVGGQVVFTVKGIVNSLPYNSHMRFDFLLSTDWNGPEDGWMWLHHNYIEVKDGTDILQIEEKIKNVLKTHVKGSNSEIILQNIKKIHLFSLGKYHFDIDGLGDIKNIRILCLIAVFILLIACINFMNLSTAQLSGRAREIGIRKVTGAKKQGIVFQFLGESLLLVIVAYLLAMILVELFLPGFNNLTGKEMRVNYQSFVLYGSMAIIVLFCGLLAGSYPAFYLSSLKPVDTVKGLINKHPGNVRFRRILVVFQFSLSILLIICTLVIRNQIYYIQNKSLGFNKDNIVCFNYPAAPWDHVLKSVKEELRKIPEIQSITAGPLSTFTVDGIMSELTWTGKKEEKDVFFSSLDADVDFARTFKLEMKEGRYFSSEFATDSSAIVINEETAKLLGFKDPVGHKITYPDGKKLNIIGIVRDFHFLSLHKKIGPLIMGLGTSNIFYARIDHNNISSTIGSIRKTYDSFKPVTPFKYHFLNDDFDNLYKTEQRMSKIFKWFALLAIIISCLGLIGLSSFMIERRTKEVGIRKINGSGSAEILKLLSGEYILLVIISIFIACPVAWLIMNKWLQNFAYHINIGWSAFVFAGSAALAISLITISFQTLKAARKNPVDALRYE